MKKLLALLLSLLMVLAVFVSCGKAEDGKKGDDAKVTASEYATFEELYTAKIEAEYEVESMSANAQADFVFNMMGADISMDMDIDMSADIKEMLFGVDATVVLDAGDFAAILGGEASTEPESVDMKIYMDLSDTGAMYLNVGEEWAKSTMPEGTMEEYYSKIEESKNLDIDYFKYMSDTEFEKTEYNGKECYKLSYAIDLKLEEMLKDMGLEGSLAEFYEATGEISKEEAEMIAAMISDMGTVYCVEYVDAETLYPVYVEIDMADAFQKLYNEIIEFAASQAEGDENMGMAMALLSSATVKEFVIKAEYTDINNSTVVIPEEALSAEEI